MMRLLNPASAELFAQLFFFFSLIAQISTITTQQLGLKINSGLALKGKYVYNAVVQFQDDIQATWTDGQIAGIAEQAYNDMRAAFTTDRKTYKQLAIPGVMSVIAQGHTAYVSSSLTGGDSFLYIPNAKAANPKLRYTPGVVNQATNAGIVEWALMACEVRTANGAGHRTGANCGEPMAALALVQITPTAELDGARVVTWGKFKDPTTKKNTEGVMDPCGPKSQNGGLDWTDTWGCTQLTGPRGLNMKAIGSGTASQVTTLSYNPTVTYPCYA